MKADNARPRRYFPALDLPAKADMYVASKSSFHPCKKQGED